MDVLKAIQTWYDSQCDGEWEHIYGIKIDNIDNPGWRVAIDLADTDMNDRHFESIKDHRSDTDWIVCEVKDQLFYGHGGALNLEEILEVFLQFVAGSSAAASQ